MDAWGVALKLLMTTVVVLGGVIAGCFRYLNVAVLDQAEAAAAGAGKMAPKKKKPLLPMLPVTLPRTRQLLLLGLALPRLCL